VVDEYARKIYGKKHWSEFEEDDQGLQWSSAPSLLSLPKQERRGSYEQMADKSRLGIKPEAPTQVGNKTWGFFETTRRAKQRSRVLIVCLSHAKPSGQHSSSHAERQEDAPDAGWRDMRWQD